MEKRVLGVIGGSGLYALEGLEGAKTFEVASSFGAPSGPIVRGALAGMEILFLARHGAGHRLPPGEIDYCANIDALKRAGATDIVSISACGSLREEMKPGDFVVIDQFIDRTTKRRSSFFGEGFVAHVSMADPVCSALAAAAAKACAEAPISSHARGTYVCIDGPQFSSRAESFLYRSWGADVIGMTNMPEAKLAREAELPYASVAMVTDYDCWRTGEKAVEVSDVLAVMDANTEKAKRMLGRLVEILGPTRSPSPQGIETTLDYAVITAPGARSAEMIETLSAVAGRFLKTGA